MLTVIFCNIVVFITICYIFNILYLYVLFNTLLSVHLPPENFNLFVMKVAVVGATGMVGEVMLKVLAERNFPVTELLVVASERSVGKKLTFQGKEHTLIGLETAVNHAQIIGPDELVLYLIQKP